MAKSRKGKKYHRPDFRAEAARLNPEKYGKPELDTPALVDRGRPLPAKGSSEASHFNRAFGQLKLPADTVRFLDPPQKTAPPRKPRATRPAAPKPPRPRTVPVDKEPPAPAHPHVMSPTAPRAARRAGRYLVPAAAAGTVVGGTAFLARRAERKKAEMTKALVDPLTGEGVAFEKRYIEDDIDSKPSGVLVAKAVKFTGVRGMRGAEFKQRARDKVGSRNVTRARRVARAPKEFASGASDNFYAGALGRTMHAFAPGEKGVANRAGRVAMGAGGSLGLYEGGRFVGRQDERDRQQRRRIAAARARRENASKRFDETALEHHGSRRVGGRLPVSSHRVPGLPVQSASFSRGNPEARPGTRSHANKLTHVHTSVKAPRGGKLFVLRRHGKGRSSTSMSTMGKSAGFAQSGGSGRRLVNI